MAVLGRYEIDAELHRRGQGSGAGADSVEPAALPQLEQSASSPNDRFRGTAGSEPRGVTATVAARTMRSAPAGHAIAMASSGSYPPENPPGRATGAPPGAGTKVTPSRSTPIGGAGTTVNASATSTTHVATSEGLRPIFVSHSSRDKMAVERVVEFLEGRGVSCWVSYRDIPPGTRWGEAIIDAINGCSGMVVLVSSYSVHSPQVVREVERAVSKNLALIPCRIDRSELSKEMEYFLSTSHWLFATNPPGPQDLEQLFEAVRHRIPSAVPRLPLWRALPDAPAPRDEGARATPRSPTAPAPLEDELSAPPRSQPPDASRQPAFSAHPLRTPTPGTRPSVGLWQLAFGKARTLDEAQSSETGAVKNAARQQKAARPRTPRRWPKRVAAALVLVAMIAAGALVGLDVLHRRADKQLASRLAGWQGTLAHAVAEDPAWRKRIAADPDLRPAVERLRDAQPLDVLTSELSAAPTDRSRLFDVRRQFARFMSARNAVDALREAERAFSPEQWSKLREVQDRRAALAAVHHDADAAALDRLIRDATPATSTDLRAGIMRLLAAPLPALPTDASAAAGAATHSNDPLATAAGRAAWLQEIDRPIDVSSDVLRKRWDDWRGGLRQQLSSAAAPTTNPADVPARLAALKAQAQAVRDRLKLLDQQFPRPPAALSAVVADAAARKREAELTALSAWANPTHVAHPATMPALDIAAASAGFNAWVADVRSLAEDFRLGETDPTKKVWALDDRPDDRWAAHPQLWADPIVQDLVRTDVSRIGRVQALRHESRDYLMQAAAGPQLELALAAWQALLNGDKVAPPWLTQPGDLLADDHIRTHIAQLAASLGALPASTAKQVAALDRQGQAPQRWARFAANADTPERLKEAVDSLDVRVPAEANRISEIDKLDKVPRLNLLLYVARAKAAEGDATEIIPSLQSAAASAKDRPEAVALGERLSAAIAKPPFDDDATGDTFDLPALPGADMRLQFRRVESAGIRPFYLSTTEVSLKQFAALAGADARDAAELRQLLAGSDASARTPLGPRGWEWSPAAPAASASASLTSAAKWLPEGLNDFAKPLRPAPAFNRQLLAPAAGGPPSPEHPIQQIPATAALFIAGRYNCRLPTAGEWRAAYNAFESSVSIQDWNLRDETWNVQKAYIAEARKSDPKLPWPDDGAFTPADVRDPAGAPISIPTGAEATARSESDGVLYFRKTSEGAGAVFKNLVGNVAEFVFDDPDRFTLAIDKPTAAGIQAFARANAPSLKAIGGSALSAKELDFKTAYPIDPTKPYADVGFRLAFTAPLPLADRLRYALADQPCLRLTPK